MLEGTSKYFWLLFLFVTIIYITVKICLFHIFKSAKIKGYKAFIPFYNRLVLTDLLDLKRSVFYKTLIPFARLYYCNIIIKKLLEAYELDSSNSILYLIVPMYKFPELVFKNPRFMLHVYDETEEFIHNEKSLFEKEKPVQEIDKTIDMNPQTYQQIPSTVFDDSSLEPDERHETIVEAKKEEKKEENPIYVNNLRPKVCPKCGTKLEPTSKVCFFCGTEV